MASSQEEPPVDRRQHPAGDRADPIWRSPGSPSPRYIRATPGASDRPLRNRGVFKSRTPAELQVDPRPSPSAAACEGPAAGHGEAMPATGPAGAIRALKIIWMVIICPDLIAHGPCSGRLTEIREPPVFSIRCSRVSEAYSERDRGGPAQAVLDGDGPRVRLAENPGVG